MRVFNSSIVITSGTHSLKHFVKYKNFSYIQEKWTEFVRTRSVFDRKNDKARKKSKGVKGLERKIKC